jgi:cytochrome c peroxidase
MKTNQCVRKKRILHLPVVSYLFLAVTSLVISVFDGASSLAQSDTDWIPSAVSQAVKMPHDLNAEQTQQQVTPAIIPPVFIGQDPSGRIGSLNVSGPTETATNEFFEDLGSNGRTCFSCHQPANGWGVSAASIQKTFLKSQGLAPIFRPVDGAVCPTADVSTLQARLTAYSLVLKKGLIRIGLPIPTGAEFIVSPLDDPYGCNTNPDTGLVTPSSGISSVYRRPLPSTNLGFLNTIMWDGREPSLQSQAADATLIHAQAAAPPSVAQINQIVAFESAQLTAQSHDQDAGNLSAAGATGGPGGLAATLADFFQGINDPLRGNPKATPFTSIIFTLFDAWAGVESSEHFDGRLAVSRGQRVFNTKPITITGVNGLNDVLGVPTIGGFCGTCHDSPNVGNHSIKLPLNIGVANAGPFDAATGTGAVPALDTIGLPVFRVSCVSGLLSGMTYTVTDLGRAMISGKCADIAKVKGPILRGLAARAPYFHNGSAATLDDVVTFYDQRFGINFTDQEKSDLVAFLKTL